MWRHKANQFDEAKGYAESAQHHTDGANHSVTTPKGSIKMTPRTRAG